MVTVCPITCIHSHRGLVIITRLSNSKTWITARVNCRILFIRYINDIPARINILSEAIKFANDTVVIIPCRKFKRFLVSVDHSSVS